MAAQSLSGGYLRELLGAGHNIRGRKERMGLRPQIFIEHVRRFYRRRFITLSFYILRLKRLYVVTDSVTVVNHQQPAIIFWWWRNHKAASALQHCGNTSGFLLYLAFVSATTVSRKLSTAARRVLYRQLWSFQKAGVLMDSGAL